MKRSAVIQIISFVLLAACGALCQQRPSADLLPRAQFDVSNSPEVQRQETRTWNSLPDAPSPVQPSPQADTFHYFVKETSQTSRPLTLGAVGTSTGVMRGITSGVQARLATLFQPMPVQRESGASAFLGKYLYPLFLKQDTRRYPLTSGNFMSRVSYAASHMFVTQDNLGKKKPNTSYIVRALASVVTHAASSPYWTQSAPARLNPARPR